MTPYISQKIERKNIFLLAPFSWLFLLAVRIRHWLYDKRIFKKRFAHACVVSIGNLVAGGTGKTQLVHLLVSRLAKKAKVAIVSRGYKGLAEKQKKPLLVNPLQVSAKVSGDEPWLLASRLQGIPVIVCKNRAKAAGVAEKLDTQVIVLDDGMQHRKLNKDFEIVTLDANDPFGGNRFLPWGNLREDPKRLSKVDLVVSIGSLAQENEEKIKMLTSALFVQMKIQVKKINLFNGEEISSIKGKRVALFCGIAGPERFVSTVQELGASVVLTHFLSDHQKIKEKELHAFANLAKEKGAEIVLCTEKDKVKLSDQLECGVLLGWIQTELEVVKNHESWEKAVKEIEQLAGVSL